MVGLVILSPLGLLAAKTVRNIISSHDYNPPTTPAEHASKLGWGVTIFEPHQQRIVTGTELSSGELPGTVTIILNFPFVTPGNTGYRVRK